MAVTAKFESSDRSVPLDGMVKAISVGSVTVAGMLYNISLLSVMPMSWTE
jgi:hypothetical protein